MILVELEAAVDAAGNVETFYVSDANFTTKPTDTPANQSFLPLITQDGVIVEVNVFSDGKTAGSTELSVGEIPIDNTGGRFDVWLDYSFEGRSVVIRQGDGGAYPADFPVVFTGTVKNLFADRSRLLIRVVDTQLIFTQPTLTATYAGTNVGSTGLEGLPGDIKGKVKPATLGKVFNIKPHCVNTANQTYRVNNGAVADIPNVYDRAVELTQGADYASAALLAAASLTVGTYGTCLAEGLFRLESDPDGEVTCDVVEGANDAARTVGQLLKRLAILAGVAPGTINETDVINLDLANPAVVGIFVDDERSFADVMDELANSIGAYYGFDVDGSFVMGVWLAPSGVSQETLADYYLGEDYERRNARDNEDLVWSVKINHSKFYKTQDNDLGGITAERRVALGLEYRSVVSEDATVRLKNKLAIKLEFDTLLTDGAAALAEGGRRLTLHRVRRDTLEVTCPLRVATRLRLASCVTVQISRFGYAGGKLMRVQGLRIPLSGGQAKVKVWG